MSGTPLHGVGDNPLDANQVSLTPHLHIMRATLALIGLNWFIRPELGDIIQNSKPLDEVKPNMLRGVSFKAGDLVAIPWSTSALSSLLDGPISGDALKIAMGAPLRELGAILLVLQRADPNLEIFIASDSRLASNGLRAGSQATHQAGVRQLWQEIWHALAARAAPAHVC